MRKLDYDFNENDRNVHYHYITSPHFFLAPHNKKHAVQKNRSFVHIKNKVVYYNYGLEILRHTRLVLYLPRTEKAINTAYGKGF